MDKKFLKENNLSESQKKFQRLYEYTFIGADELTNEADDEDMEDFQSDQGSDESPLQGEAGQNQDQNQGIADNDIQPDFSMDDNGGEVSGGVEGFNPEENDDVNMDFGDEDTEDEEVIDVDDLTSAQEETNDKVDNLKIDFDKLNNMISKVESYIEKNNQNIESLKAELEKRNPTELEKLSMRTKDSYPFNVKPEDYWAEKEATSNYRVGDDENGKEQGQYVITKNDIDGMTDWKSISDSLSNSDLNQTLTKILGM